MDERPVRKKQRGRGPRQSGMALIVVLWLLVILTMLVTGLGNRAGVDVEMMRYDLGLKKARSLARAGIMVVRAKIQDAGGRVINTLAHSGVTLADGQTVEDLFKEVRLDDGYFDVFYPVAEEDGVSQERYGLSDETRRINLNALNYDNYRVLYHLIVDKGYDTATAETIAASLIDWRDADDNVFNDPYGAEDLDYENLGVAYRCKNAALESREELLLIKGMTPEIYDAIQADLTVFPERGVLRLNLNTASQSVLLAYARSLLGAKTNAAEADAVSLVAKLLSYRAGPDGVEGTADDLAVDVNKMALNAREKALFLMMALIQADDASYLRARARGVEDRSGITAVIEAVIRREDLAVVSWRWLSGDEI